MKAAAGSADAFPWDSVMATGFGLLRLSPQAFWSMTPREMERAMSVFRPTATGAPKPGDLAGLMRVFPDTPSM